MKRGVTTCVATKSKAFNRFLPNYESTKLTSFIVQLDVTNVYGWAMRQCLLQENFDWPFQENIQWPDINTIPYKSAVE